uniref:Secretory protein 30C02 n=1 Tax=Heterodera glycines TaxID=51029 RepID=A0A7D6HBA3_HETGL|nr:secretory protein 30C02 [Heterodera glycines]
MRKLPILALIFCLLLLTTEGSIFRRKKQKEKFIEQRTKNTKKKPRVWPKSHFFKWQWHVWPIEWIFKWPIWRLQCLFK